MKARLASLLRCPITGEALTLVAWETFERPLDTAARSRATALGIDPEELAHEIQAGVLLSPSARVAFPIVDGVPRLLRFRAGVIADFDARYGRRMREEHPGLVLPGEPSEPGEEEVLRTFSSEWVDYDWDGDVYWNQSASAWFRSMDYVLSIDAGALDGKRVLEVGIGIGGVANHVATSSACEVIGMDLGYAVDAAYRHFGSNPFLHIVQTSAFHPPFQKSSFDFVYSFGVLHHTHSTQQAFGRVADLVVDGGRLFIWVYSPANEARSPLRRVLMAVERVARPAITRLSPRAQSVALMPAVPAYMTWQALQVLRGNADAMYGVREAMHAARDRLTPRFAHRHTEDEVAGWFKDARYEQLRLGSAREKPPWLPVGFLANTAVDGVRGSGAS